MSFNMAQRYTASQVPVVDILDISDAEEEFNTRDSDNSEEFETESDVEDVINDQTKSAQNTKNMFFDIFSVIIDVFGAKLVICVHIFILVSHSFDI